MKTVIITGGSRGIGAAAVRAFCARGDRVAFLYEKEDEKAQAVAAETGAQAVRCDVADEAAIRAAFSQLPGADVLINNAGIADYDLINVITPARWRRLFAVNVDGAFYCIRAALPHMLQQQSGCIINVSSMWGQVGASCEAAYSATKGAILALTKALAQELGPSGIRVNAVAPGVIRTDMCASVDPAVMEDLRQQTPIGRLGTPEDIYNEPKNAFVADFIGESNIIDGIMPEDNVVQMYGRRFPCLDGGFAPNEAVDVVIRPEDIDIVPVEQGQLTGTVTSVTFKGMQYDIIVDFRGFKWLILTTDHCREGARFGIKIDPDGMHVMKKSAYSGMFGDYSSFSEEYDELDDATLSSDEEESGDEE